MGRSGLAGRGTGGSSEPGTTSGAVHGVIQSHVFHNISVP
jgi:hypothetical protein